MPALFDDPSLVSALGLVSIMRLADEAGLPTLNQDRLSVPIDKTPAVAKIASLIGRRTIYQHYGPVASLRNDHTAQPDLCAVDPGAVPTAVDLRIRTPVGCRGLPISGQLAQISTSPGPCSHW